MSGNMSFVNSSSVTGAGGTVGTLSSVVVSNREERIMATSSATLASRARESVSFSEGNLPTTSFQEDGQDSPASEARDTDVWGTRIILSGIEDFVFTETPFPKLPPDLILSFQKLLLSANVASSNINPFVDLSKSNNSYDLCEKRETGKGKNQLEISNEAMETLERCSPESKIVVRTLITAYIRNIAVNVMENFRPIVESSGLKLQSSPPSSVAKKKVGTSGTATATGGTVDSDMKASFDLIISALKEFQNQSTQMDDKIRDLMKLRDDEMKKYNRDLKQFKKLTVDIMKEHSKQQDPDFVKQYLDYIQTEKEYVMEQLRFENLQKESEENPENIRKGTDEAYKNVKALYDKMIPETSEMERRLELYKDLGNDYLKVLEKYTAVEEEIKTKEWVKEQLQNGPRDDSLLSDSFYE